MTDEAPQSIHDINAMRDGVDYSFTIKVRSFDIKLRPLSLYETRQANIDMIQDIKGNPEILQNALEQNLSTAKHILRYASTTDVGKKDSPLTDEFFERMTPDELQFLFKQYRDGLDKVNPSLEEITKEEIQSLIEEVKQDPLVLITYSRLQLSGLVGHMLPFLPPDA